MNPIIIAIDGYSSTGKSTLAKALASILGYTYIDSGAMYRAVALYALRCGYVNDSVIKVDQLVTKLPEINISFVLAEDLNSEICLNGEKVESEIRGMEVSNCVSQVSAIPQVREMLVAQQQLMGNKKAVVMDGRDIGSVVFPNAELKLFMTASEDIRAQRRYHELIAKGSEVSIEEVKANLSKRDYIDSHRDTAPLIQTNDAIVLDNSHLSQKEQLDWVLEKVKQISSSLG
jgi:cytidylate kinase